MPQPLTVPAFWDSQLERATLASDSEQLFALEKNVWKNIAVEFKDERGRTYTKSFQVKRVETCSKLTGFHIRESSLIKRKIATGIFKSKYRAALQETLPIRRFRKDANSAHTTTVIEENTYQISLNTLCEHPQDGAAIGQKLHRKAESDVELNIQRSCTPVSLTCEVGSENHISTNAITMKTRQGQLFDIKAVSSVSQIKKLSNDPKPTIIIDIDDVLLSALPEKEWGGELSDKTTLVETNARAKLLTLRESYPEHNILLMSNSSQNKLIEKLKVVGLSEIEIKQFECDGYELQDEASSILLSTSDRSGIDKGQRVLQYLRDKGIAPREIIFVAHSMQSHHEIVDRFYCNDAKAEFPETKVNHLLHIGGTDNRLRQLSINERSPFAELFEEHEGLLLGYNLNLYLSASHAREQSRMREEFRQSLPEIECKVDIEKHHVTNVDVSELRKKSPVTHNWKEVTFRIKDSLTGKVSKKTYQIKQVQTQSGILSFVLRENSRVRRALAALGIKTTEIKQLEQSMPVLQVNPYYREEAVESVDGDAANANSCDSGQFLAAPIQLKSLDKTPHELKAEQLELHKVELEPETLTPKKLENEQRKRYPTRARQCEADQPMPVSVLSDKGVMYSEIDICSNEQDIKASTSIRSLAKMITGTKPLIAIDVDETLVKHINREATTEEKRFAAFEAGAQQVLNKIKADYPEAHIILVSRGRGTVSKMDKAQLKGWYDKVIDLEMTTQDKEKYGRDKGDQIWNYFMSDFPEADQIIFVDDGLEQHNIVIEVTKQKVADQAECPEPVILPPISHLFFVQGTVFKFQGFAKEDLKNVSKGLTTKQAEAKIYREDKNVRIGCNLYAQLRKREIAAAQHKKRKALLKEFAQEQKKKDKELKIKEKQQRKLISDDLNTSMLKLGMPFPEVL
ncbi:hypothetical protein SOPP22_02820 [Shewanella sp. OPT22]|nr:hypothetical protein SOPP22_02820 [Shewanella sp. OPT22]